MSPPWLGASRFVRSAAMAALALALAAPGGAAAATANARRSWLGFNVVLLFTPEAARRLESTGESVVVDAYWYGAPMPSHMKQADQVGQIVVGSERRVLPPTARRVRVTGRSARPERRDWLVNRRVFVNVNVFSARRTSPDNILDCAFFDDALARARRGVALRCGLLKLAAGSGVKR